MFSSRYFSAALTLSLACTACSKKQETPSENAATTQQEAKASDPVTSAPGGAADLESTTAPVQFNQPEAESAAEEARPAPTAGELPQQLTGPSNKTEPAELRAYFPPFYPLSLRMEGVEGRIDLRIMINENGDVTEVSVLNATAPQFREYAVEAAKRWKFLPATKDGLPVAAVITIPVSFVSEFGSGRMPANSPLARLTFLDGMYYTTDANGRYEPANQQLTPLVRQQPSFKIPAGSTEAMRATLMFTVTEEGQVLNPEVVDTTNEAFGEAAVEAVVFWQFIPRIRNGKPLSSQVKLPIVLGAEDNAN